MPALNLYPFRVAPGAEPRFTAGFSNVVELRRQIPVRREGRIQDSLAPLFNGVLFLQTSIQPAETTFNKERLSAELEALEATAGFIDFLPRKEPRALAGEDYALVSHFLQEGKAVPVGISSVYFDPRKDYHIQVAEGPLKGLENKVFMVNKRKYKVRLRLKLLGEDYEVDFPFQLVQGQDIQGLNEELYAAGYKIINR
jgi:transcription antitermination factor NusG